MDFERLLASLDETSIQISASNAQEIHQERNKIGIMKGMQCKAIDNKLQLEITDSIAEIKFNTASAGLPSSWRDYSYLKLKLENTSPENVKVTVVLWAPRGRLPDTLYLRSYQTVEKYIDLHDLPLIGSVQNKYQVDEVAFHFNTRNSANISIEAIALVEEDGKKDFVVVDRFGQRKSTDWPGKVKTDDELLKHRIAEKKSLTGIFNSNSYDSFYGLKTKNKYPTNGFFSMGYEVIDGINTWFFVTPEGNPFWSFGVTGIRPTKAYNAVTLVKGNEQLFEELPDRKGPYADAYIDSTLSFYKLNLLRKYGGLQAWREVSMKRLSSWGMNTIGNWAEDSLLMQSKMPFTYALETSVRRWKMDVYSPEWQTYVDSVFSRVTQLRENKYLLGYFVDNEGGWGNLKLPENLPQNAFLRQIWKEYLTDNYTSISEYNLRYSTQFSSWEDLVASNNSDNISQEEIIQLEKLYTERYFRIISETLKKYDPNHLYLGCRFTRKLKPNYILQIAGKYCDAISVNVYSYEPIKEEMDAWHQMTGKPILIGEHQAALNSPRQLPLRWQTFTEEERFDYFVNYVKVWASMPYSLGCHWYQYADQDITGRVSNGENQIIGFVDITDQPYTKMIEAVQFNSQNMYMWHGMDR